MRIWAIFAALLFLSAPSLAATPDQLHKLANRQPYSGNVKTMKYHKEDCKFYDCRDCKKFFKTPKEAEKEGFQQCKVCWK